MLVTGIHGKPPIPWDNVKGISDPAFGGYCTHGSVIFPTWHRPYVVLYEVFCFIYFLASSKSILVDFSKSYGKGHPP